MRKNAVGSQNQDLLYQITGKKSLKKHCDLHSFTKSYEFRFAFRKRDQPISSYGVGSNKKDNLLQEYLLARFDASSITISSNLFGDHIDAEMF
jgi:hypothetical protein